jgi:uncharacterized Zn finger protein (UPF0148 family)
MSNTRYYARRAAAVCPDCGVPVQGSVYCPFHREWRRECVAADRQRDRAGWNLYMRVYKQQRREAKISA